MAIILLFPAGNKSKITDLLYNVGKELTEHYFILKSIKLLVGTFE